MSITTTEYIQRLIITTDDSGETTTARTYHASTRTAYLFNELDEAAQARAIADAIKEEEEDYYSTGIYGCSITGSAEAEIWDAARDLEKNQPVYFGTDAGGSPYGTARRYRFSSINWENVTEQQDTGICWSMDICDRWNTYARRIIALQEAHEEATDRAYLHSENAYNAEKNNNSAIAAKEYERSAIYNRIVERIEKAAEELTEEAARAVGNLIDGLIEAEADYYTSADFWRGWLSDSDERYNRAGIRL